MRYRQAGVGLVELMISLVLGLLILALAMQMFLGSRASQSSQQALSYLQESARYVSFRLQPLMRNIGYAGCTSVQPISIASSVDSQYRLLPSISTKKAVQDGIDYWELDWVYADKESEVPLAAAMKTSVSELDIGADSSGVFLDKNGKVIEKIALISDCNTADVFQIENDTIPGSRIKPDGKLSRAYGQIGSAASHVYPIKAWRLFLGEQQGSGTTALFIDRVEAVSSFKREELVAGVSDLAISFGVDTNDDGSIDQPAATPKAVDENAWASRIRRVEIALTLQSDPGVVPGGANDGRLERTFTMTFTPRNLQLRGNS
ncbi:hypothetical protein [Halomonas sp. PR-M31]|uniref:hypothetical protein n=1 Tax=Halomonas sp. PR-M31 TaxID=1471202 RepID=UPI0006517D58|nr:hypothetical protein [Halomonas sp. PR-M31]